MSEELLQRNLIENPEKIGIWNFYNIGSTTVNALKEAGIIRSIDYGAVARKKIDALITRQKEVIAIVEYKHPKQFNTKDKKSKAILQEIEVAKKLKTKLIIATDTQETLWINVATGNNVKDKDGKEFKHSFNPKDENLQKIIEGIIQSINEKNDKILPKKLIDPTGLAKQIWQDVWSVSGATPENCLYTFVELFIFKYLSDLNILQSTYNFYNLLKMYEQGNELNTVLQHYANIIRPKIKELFPESPLDKTTIINGTIFISKDQKAVDGYSMVFKKVLEKFKDYGKLEYIDHDFKSKLFESFLKESISKKNWGQFFTPIKVVRAVNEMAEGELKEGMIVCDPACGVGKFPLEYVKENIDKFFKVEAGKIKSHIKIIGFDKGFDKDEQKTIILAKANMLIYFCELIKENPAYTKHFAELFNNSFVLKTNSILGTLFEPAIDKYDLILTNPPYVTSGSSNLKEEISKSSDLKKYYKINAMGVEGLFMEWIIRALKPGGKAFIIVPDGIFNRQNGNNLRQFILDNCYIDAIISLPIKTFFTTPKKTYILAITKKNNLSELQINPVFTYLCSEIGESRDIYRFEIGQDDLKEAVELFKSFKGNKTGFVKLNRDKRCKIQNIEKFKPNKNWSIDRWFTKKEKIEIGILEEDNVVDVIAFTELVNDVSESLNNSCQFLKQLGEEKKKLTNNFKEISLADKRYFDLFIGKRLVKKDLINIKGNIPVYSANVFNPIGCHYKSNIENFDNNFVIWGIDGDFEFNFIATGIPFVTTDHCGAIRILADDILPKYLMLQLSNVKHQYGFDRGLRSSLKNMAQISVKVPINLKGKFDVESQKGVLEKYKIINELKQKIREYKNTLSTLSVEIKSQVTYKAISIGELFEFPSTNSNITKEFCINNKGEIPVYASSKSEKSVLGCIKNNIDKIHYYENCLSWNRNGSVGYVFIRNHRFTTNEDHRAMLIKKDFINKLSKNYLKYEIEKRLFELGFSFLDKCGVAKIKKVLISIPINAAGNFDLQKQKEIAGKYQVIKEIKKSIKEELEKIENIKVDVGL